MMADKPAFIEALYVTGVTYDIGEIEEALGISWCDVEDFWVKWCHLFLQMRDGTTHEVLREVGDTDWKRPYELRVLSGDYEEINDEDT